MNQRHALLALALALSALVIGACKREAATPAAPVAEAAPMEEAKSAVLAQVDHNSPASAAPAFDGKAFAGTYAGILPCADCQGIDTTIVFVPEGGYTLSEIYQDGSDSSFVTKGTWTVQEDGKTLLLDPEDKEERDRSFEVVSATELRTTGTDGKAGDSLRRK